ncbi:MAG: thiamine phosphate synthase [Sandaracinaceae bacterium]|nr:thiamine phosphate synthase [Sandaracinaceae bacterium]
MTFDLMLITDASLAAGLAERTRRALHGARPHRVALQLRCKQLTDRQLLPLARELCELAHEYKAVFLVNGRPDIALLVGADGVHLPQSGISVADARALLRPAMQVGVSCHDEVSLSAAQSAGADYALLSPFADSPGKGQALGPMRFASLMKSLSMRVLALGGIDANNAAAAKQAGAAGVAVIRAVYDASEPGAALAELLRILDTSPSLAR